MVAKDFEGSSPDRLTLVAAADRLGLSVDTLRRRIKRGLLPAQQGNDGRWYITVAEAERHGQRKRSAAYAYGQKSVEASAVAQPPGNAVTEELRARLADRDWQIEQLRADLERERGEHRGRLDHLQAERDRERIERDQQIRHLQADLTRAHAEIDTAREAWTTALREGQSERAVLLQQYQQERDRLRTDYAAELARLQHLIDRLTAPWWRRWFQR